MQQVHTRSKEEVSKAHNEVKQLKEELASTKRLQELSVIAEQREFETMRET